MKQAKKIILLAVLLAIVLGAAVWGYPRLVERYEADRLAATPAPSATPAPDAQAPDDTAGDAPVSTAAPEATPVIAPDFTVYDGDGNAVRLTVLWANRLCSISGRHGAVPAVRSWATLTRCTKPMATGSG